MTFRDAFECPACGAGLDDVSALARSLACKHCGSWVCFDNSSWVNAGKFEHQIEAPPFLHVDRSGSLKGRPFVVSGRLRLGYGPAGSHGHWDEWWLEFEDGSGQWLEEDDGSYHLHESLQHELDSASASKISAGQMVTVDARQWFVTETSDAILLGAEGQLPWQAKPGSKVFTFDALAGGWELSVEVWDGEVSATKSQKLSAAELKWSGS